MYNNIKDLRIEKELFPLFDNTINGYSKKILKDLLNNKLNSIEEIEYRQKILKGFISNYDILKDFSYTKRNLTEVYNFIETETFEIYLNKNKRFFIRLKNKHNHPVYSKIIQAILLFQRLNTYYFSKIIPDYFPSPYKESITFLVSFLIELRTEYYEDLFLRNKFNSKNIIDVIELFSRKKNNKDFERFWDLLFEFEAYLSVSQCIIKHKWNFPSITSNKLSLIDFYHPLLVNPVLNSFEPEKNVIILTGPNMSGKSTFLRAIGICIYFANLGLAIPAARAQIPFRESISISIDLNDNVLKGFSHFMVEIQNLKKVLNEANNKKCFAVFDELFRGTNNEDALEITYATIKGLIKYKDSIFIISTHLHELKNSDVIQNDYIEKFHIDCKIENNEPAFTYKINKGWSDLKLGRILFEKEGIYKLL